MKKKRIKDLKGRKHYVPTTRYDGKSELVEVAYEVAKVINNMNCAIRKKEEYHSRCNCPKKYIHLCQGDCPGCKFFKDGNMIHYDKFIKGTDISLWETIYDEKSPENIVVYKSELTELVNDIKSLLSFGEDYIDMIMDGLSESEIARRLGIKRSTLSTKTNNMKRILREKYKNLRQLDRFNSSYILEEIIEKR